MELTEVEKKLIAGLKLNSVPKGKAAVIFMLLQEKEQQLEMLQYILENEQATPDELLDVARRLAG